MPDRGAPPAAPRRPATGQVLRWGGFAVALTAMVAGIFNLVFAPWGNDPDGVLYGLRGIGYVDSLSYTFRDLDAMSRYYFSGGSAVLVAGAACLAVTAGVRARWSKGIAAGLAAMVVALFLLAAWGRNESARAPYLRYEGSDLLVAAAVLLGLAVLVAAAVTALLFGAHNLYSGFAVAAPLAIALLHVWSMYALSRYPDSGVRLTVLAWTPAAWYLLGAGGALLATIGAALRLPVPVAHQPAAVPPPAGATGPSWQ